MSIEELKAELSALPAETRRQLMAFMVALQDQERGGYLAKLTAKLDDDSPHRWLTIEQCEKKLGL